PLLVAQLAALRLGLAQPLGQLVVQALDADLDALEVRREGLVEVVEVPLAVHQERARDVVEALEGGLVQAARERLGEGDGLVEAHRYAPPPQLEEEGDDHALAPEA